MSGDANSYLATSLVLGDYFGCAYGDTTTAAPLCWGANHRGQTGQAIAQAAPAPINHAAAGAPSLASGRNHVCGLFNDATAGASSTVSCWGLNDKGQATESLPVDLASYRVVTLAALGPQGANYLFTLPRLIAAGANHSCVQSAEDSGELEIVACWGANDANQLPTSTALSDTYAQWQFDGDSPPTELSSGGDYTCLTSGETGAVGPQCWGTLGSETSSTNMPTAIASLQPNSDHSSVIDLGIADTAIWGAESPSKVIGNEEAGYFGDPQLPEVMNETSFRNASTDLVGEMAQGTAAHRCYSTTAGVLKCGGPNGAGQIPGAADVASAPITSADVSSLNGLFNNWTAGGAPHLAVGAHHTCAVTNVGDLFCWGDNSSFQLGIQDSTSKVLLPNGTSGKWINVVAGDRHTCATLQSLDGPDASFEVYCWGAGDLGQLGSEVVTVDESIEPSFQRLPTLLH